MAVIGISVSLRNTTGSTITIGTLSITAGNTVAIWDTINYIEAVLDNFVQIPEDIGIFNQNIGSGGLVMVRDTVDLTSQQAWDQYHELINAYSQYDIAVIGFSMLRGEAEDTKGLVVDINGDSSFTGPLNLDGNNINDVGTVDGYNLSNMFSGAQGSLVYRGASEWLSLPPGTDGYVLTSHGSGADPTWNISGSGSGDVVGPSGATMNAIARFDGTTGKLIKNSTVTIADDGYISSTAGLSVANITVTGNITISGLVDGVDVSAHASRHNPGGADAISTAAAVGLTADSTSIEGNSTSLARSNHTHAIDVTTGTISTINGGDAAVDGTAAGLARRDHQHAVATATAVTLTAVTTNATGNSTSLSRANHTHAITTEIAVGLSATTVNAIGDSTGLARANHTHAIDVTDGTIATINAGDASAEGTGTGLSRRDHQHAVATAAASTLSGSNAEGTSNSLARADHNHALGGTVGGDLSGTLPNPTVVDLTITNEAHGDILYRNATNWVRLAAGADGYVLTTHGAGANPTWNVASSTSSGGGGVCVYSLGMSTDLTINVEQNDALWGSLVVPVQSVTINRLSCQVAQAATGNVYLAIYDTSFNLIVADSTGVSCGTVGLKTVTISSTTLSAGTAYYLCARSDANGSRFSGATCSSGTATPQFSIRKDSAAASSFPANFVSPSINSSIMWVCGYSV